MPTIHASGVGSRWWARFALPTLREDCGVLSGVSCGNGTERNSVKGTLVGVAGKAMGSRRNNRHHNQGPSRRTNVAKPQEERGGQIASTRQSQPQAALAEAVRGGNQPTKNYERRIANWTVVVGAFTVVLAVATVGSGYVLWTTDHTLKDTMEAANRAWIAPLGAEISGAVIAGQEMNYVISYRNLGREPATSVTYVTLAGNTESPSVGRAPAFPINASCGDLKSDNGTVVYPSDTGIYQLYSAVKASAVNDRLIGGKVVEYLMGCFRYETMGKIRYSPYCFYLEPQADKPIGSWQFKVCPRIERPT